MNLKKCIYSGGLNLTSGEYYNVLEDDVSRGMLKVSDNNGDAVWVAEHCFDL